MAERERWKPIPSLEGKYEASSLGDIRHAKTKKRRRRYLHVNTDYAFTTIYWRGCNRTVNVAPLIAEAFLGPRPATLQVNHVNQQKTDDRAANLEYVTQSENIRQSFKKSDRLRRNGRPLSQQGRDKVKELWHTGKYSQVQIGEILGIHNSTVSLIVNDKLGPRVGTRNLTERAVDVSRKKGVVKSLTIGGVTRPFRDWLALYNLSRTT